MAMLGSSCSPCCGCSTGEQCASGCCINSRCSPCPDFVTGCGFCEQLGFESDPTPDTVTVSFSDLPGCFAALNGTSVVLTKGISKCLFVASSCGWSISALYGAVPETAVVEIFASDATSLPMYTSGNPADFYFVCEAPVLEFTATFGETAAAATVSPGGDYDDGCTTLPSWFPAKVQYTLSSDDFDVGDVCGIPESGEADVIINCNCVNPILEPEAYIQIDPGNCDEAAVLFAPLFGCGGDYAAPQWDSFINVFFDPTGGDPGGPGPSMFLIHCVITV